MTSCEFEYGTSSLYGQSAPCAELPGAGSAPVQVGASLTGLQANTEYHYRLVAGNANGVSYAQDDQLLTLSPPLVQSEPPTNVAVDTATLQGQVNPMGFAASYHFEYGTSTGYGTSTVTASAGSGGEYMQSSQPIAGLQPGTTYHYRLVASSANGTSSGTDTTLTTSPEPVSAAADTCPNAVLRAASRSSALPDCRAYEMVSPLDKNGADIDGTGGGHTGIAAANGERVAYEARTGFATTSGSGYAGGTQYVATRTPAGWNSRGVTPTPARAAWQTLTAVTQVIGFSSDLGSALVEAYDLPGVSNDALSAENLYAEDTQSGQLTAVTTPLGADTIGLQDLGHGEEGYSGDLEVVVFETPDSMLPQTNGVPNNKVYAWEHGVLKLADILPDGTIPSGGATEALPSVERNEDVSSDGSRVLFLAPEDGSAAPQLYMRKNGASTAWISQSEASTPDPGPQNLAFQAASADKTRVVFTTSDRLTDTDPGGAGLGLYLYSDSPDPASESNLTFIARIKTEGSNRPGTMVPGMSDNGSLIYFSTDATLGLTRGTYLWDNGAIRHVTSAISRSENQEQRVSSDGRRFAFMSREQLTSQATGADPAGGGNFTAMYLYDNTNRSLQCLSCLPTGAATTSNVVVAPYVTNTSLVVDYTLQIHPLSSDGHYVYFSTADALVPQDTNGLSDVYEYNTETEKVELLSTGTGDDGAWLLDASASGEDVFFLTRQPLLKGDTDTLVDLYDARVNGGFAESAGALAPCSGDACQGTPSAAPSFNTASGFSGLGNEPAKATSKSKPKAKPKKAKPKRKAARKKHKGKHTKTRRKSGKQASRRVRR